MVRAEPSSHRVAIVRGIEDDEVVQQIGIYLVGAGFLRAVSTDLRITQAFLRLAPDVEDQMRRAVTQRIGADNGISDQVRQTERDPWIAEGIAHLVLWLSRRTAALAARGRVKALMTLHVQPKEPGIDLTALFDDRLTLGVTLGEAKASELDATGQVRDAASFFSTMDDDVVRQVQLRNAVQLLRKSLRAELEGLITPALWEENRCYLPLVAYSDASSFAPSRARNSYRSLRPGAEGVLLICLPLADYRGFFDRVSDAMRSAL